MLTQGVTLNMFAPGVTRPSDATACGLNLLTPMVVAGREKWNPVTQGMFWPPATRNSGSLQL